VPHVPSIASRQHEIVQACRRLARQPGDDGSVLLDGEHLVAEALLAKVPVRALLTIDPDHRVAADAQSAGAAVFRVTQEVLDAASPVRTPSGLVAIAEWRPATLAAACAAAPALVLALVDVQDPGNLGAIVRSAHALGATGVVTTVGGADPRGWKALRGSMGSTFHVPVARASIDDVLMLASQRGLSVAAATAGPGEPLDRVDLAAPLLILLGTEGGGLPASLVAQAGVTLTIPMRPGARSLNVAVAAAVLLYEATRQRKAGSHRP
jgi:RNA methyltransferase, TrmH family